MPTRRRLTVLKAPTGFGKTTQLAECCRSLAEQGVPVAWISLDKRDDPRLLDTYIAYACISAGLDAGDTADPDDTGDAVGTGAAQLAHGVMSLDGPFVLALDDVDRLNNPESLGLVEFLLNNGPPNLHLALTCRELPAGLNVGGLLLEGRATVLGVEDLRFSKSEIEQFFGPGVSENALNEIAAETDGWPIAVRISHSGRENADLTDSGTLGELIANWMDSRFFEEFEPEDREFLLDLGLFEHLDARILDEVLERTDSMRRIEAMPALNGLLKNLPGEAADKRSLHPYIREHCVRRRFREDPERFRAINGRIATALMRRGDTVGAMRYALEAGDRTLAGDVLEEAGVAGMLIGKGVNRFIAAARLLDEEIISGRPRLRLFRCLAQALTGHLEEARKGYAATSAAIRAHAGDGNDGDFDLSLDECFVRSDMGRYGTEPLGSAWVEALSSDLSRLEGSPRLDPSAYGNLQFRLAAGYQLAAQFDAARACVAAAQTSLANDAYVNSLVDLESGQIAMAEGRVADAEGYYASVRREARKRRAFEALPAATARILLEELALECNRLAPRPRLLDAPRGLAIIANSFSAHAAAGAIAIDLRLRQEGADAALAAANRLLNFFGDIGSPVLARYISALKVSLLVTAARVEEAEREWHLRDLPGNPADCLDLTGQTWREMEALSCARLRLMTGQGRFDEGRGFAADLRAVAAERNLKRTLMRALSLSVALELRADKSSTAKKLLREFLRHYGESPYARSMVRDRETNRPAVEACLRSVKDRSAGEALRSLMSAMRAPDTSEYQVMSNRELQVLDHLETHQDKHIARALGLTPFGVRYHIRKIFAKLGVHDRAAAVRRASELGFLIGVSANDRH